MDESYCIHCGNYTQNINPNMGESLNGQLYLKSNCDDCGRKKSKFIPNYNGGKLDLTSLKKIVKPRIIAPPNVRNFLIKYGYYYITDIKVCRQPIDAAIEYVLNLITIGQFNKNKKKIGYDDLYHLYLILTIQNTEDELIKIKIEKNHVVEITKNNIKDDKCIDVPLKNYIFVKNFFENGNKYQGSSFWLYDARDNNCQIFVNSLFEGNNLNNEKIKNYVLQDVSSLLSNKIHSISKKITDIAGISDIIRHGYGY